jgi:hypothetical protein
MNKSLNKQLHTNPEVNADMKNYEIEDENTINSISNDEKVCIYNLPNQNIVYFV